MSNYSKEQLDDLFERSEHQLRVLAEEARTFEVNLDIKISSEGDIEFSSREYFDEEGKKYVQVHSHTQGVSFREDSSRVTVLKEYK